MANPFELADAAPQQTTEVAQAATSANPWNVLDGGESDGQQDTMQDDTVEPVADNDSGDAPANVDEAIEGLGETWDSAFKKVYEVVAVELPKLISWYEENKEQLSKLSGQTTEFSIMAFVVTEVVKDGGKLLAEHGIPIPNISLKGLDLSEALVTVLTFWNPVKKHLPKRVQKLLTAWLLLRWFGKGIAYSTFGLNEASAKNSWKKLAVDVIFDFVGEFYPPKIVVDTLAQAVRGNQRPEEYVLGDGSILKDNYGNTYEVTETNKLKQQEDGYNSKAGDVYQLKYNNKQREYFIGQLNGVYYRLTVVRTVKATEEQISKATYGKGQETEYNFDDPNAPNYVVQQKADLPTAPNRPEFFNRGGPAMDPMRAKFYNKGRYVVS